MSVQRDFVNSGSDEAFIPLSATFVYSSVRKTFSYAEGHQQDRPGGVFGCFDTKSHTAGLSPVLSLPLGTTRCHELRKGLNGNKGAVYLMVRQHEVGKPESLLRGIGHLDYCGAGRSHRRFPADVGSRRLETIRKTRGQRTP